MEARCHLLSNQNPFKSACRQRRTRKSIARCDSSAPRAHQSQRRDILSAAVLLASQLCRPNTARAVEEADSPQIGACVECIGEVNGGLNACTLASPSCVSTQNDDEAHFIPPWQYNGPVEEAVQELINIATGRNRVLVAESGAKISLKDAADYSFEELQEFLKGKAPPKKPKGKPVAAKACFSGAVESQHRAEDGSEYIYIVFGGKNAVDPDCRRIGAIDAEFIFLSGDNVVDIRAASRKDPGVRGSNLSLSLSYGVQYDTNVAKREMEELRKALRWEQVPVVTDFDPRFNQRRPLFFERLYQPFLREKQDFEDIVDK